MMSTLSYKTKPGNCGLVQGARPLFMTEKSLLRSPIKTAKPSRNIWGITEDRKGNIWLAEEGLWRYDGSFFTKVSKTGAGAIIEDKKGNIWTSGGINPSTWAFYRYDQQSLYSKKATVTEIMTRGPALFGILEANDGSIWIGASDGVYRYDGRDRNGL